MADSLDSTFTRTEQHLDQGDWKLALQVVSQELRDQKRYSELFEILKSEIRLDLGLPVDFASDTDQLPDEQQRTLEDRLLSACMEIGQLLVNDGRISEGWMYLQPVIDRGTVVKIIESATVNDENIDEVIEIALCQWAAPQFGYRLLLENQGTCNGITFFDTQINYQSNEIRQKLAEILVEHIYQELSRNIKICIHDNEPNQQLSENLYQLIESRQWLFDHCGHHLDVTHLASAVRIARFCHDANAINKALELCEYGVRLDDQLKYDSESPFDNIYADHLKYFEALSNKNVDDVLDYFESKLSSADDDQMPLPAVQIIAELCARTDRSSRGLKLLLRAIDQQDESAIHMLFSIASSKHDFAELMSYFRQRGNLLGFGLSGLRKCLLNK